MINQYVGGWYKLFNLDNIGKRGVEALSPIVPKNGVLTSYKLLLLTSFGFWKYTRSSENYFINNAESNACLCFTLIFLFQDIFRVHIIIIADQQLQRKVKPVSETIREGGEVEAGWYKRNRKRLQRKRNGQSGSSQ